jgi:hypothetical protein
MTTVECPDEHAAQFSCGALRSVSVYKYCVTELDSSPELAGWYAWYYVPTEWRRVNLVLSKSAELTVDVGSVFGSRYAGTIAIASATAAEAKPAWFSSLQTTMLAFGTPLYVGIASVLRRRLLVHRMQLERRLREELAWTAPRIPAQDTDEESTYFASRIAPLLKNFQLPIHSLYVKVVTSANRSHLRPVESVLNQAWCPPYGRK